MSFTLFAAASTALASGGAAHTAEPLIGAAQEGPSLGYEATIFAAQEAAPRRQQPRQALSYPIPPKLNNYQPVPAARSIPARRRTNTVNPAITYTTPNSPALNSSFDGVSYTRRPPTANFVASVNMPHMQELNRCAARANGASTGFDRCVQQAMRGAKSMLTERWNRLLSYAPAGGTQDATRLRRQLIDEQRGWLLFAEQACQSQNSPARSSSGTAQAPNRSCQLEVLNARLGRLDALIANLGG